MSWRNEISVHPAADLFPLLNEQDLRALGEDITEKKWLTHQIAITLIKNHPVLVDGRNRLDAMELFGLSVKLEMTGSEWRLLVKYPDGSQMSGPCEIVKAEDVTEYIASVNIHRRHLTAEIKRNLIAALIKSNPEKSDRQIAKLVNASPTTVGDERKKTCPDLDTSIDTKGRRQSRHKPKTTAAERAWAKDVVAHPDSYCVGMHPVAQEIVRRDAQDTGRPARKSEKDKALDKLMDIMLAVGRLTGFMPADQMVRYFVDNGLDITERDREQIAEAAGWLNDFYLASAPPTAEDAPEIAPAQEMQETKTTATGEMPEMPAFLDRRPKAEAA